MSKRTCLILLICLLIFTTVSCNGKDDGNEITGIVTETGNNDFLIQVIDGYQEDEMKVNITRKTKFEEGVSEQISVGNAIGFTIKNEVMESYPVQAEAKTIKWNEMIVKGNILSAGENALLLKVTEGLDSDLIQVLINEECLFYNNIPEIMEKDKMVGFTITGEIIGSNPIQVYAKRFVVYE